MPRPSGVSNDPVTGLKWGKAVFAEQRRYSFAEGGRLKALASRVGDYMSALAANMEFGMFALEGQGLAINATSKGFTVDSSWRLGPSDDVFPPDGEGSNGEFSAGEDQGRLETLAGDRAAESPFSGELRLRIVGQGKPKGVKPPKRTLARNYNGIKDYAIGINFDPSDASFDEFFRTDLILQYKSSGKQYTLKSLPAQSWFEVLDPARVVGHSALGNFAQMFAGAVDLTDPAKQLDRGSFAFAAEFPADWHTSAAGWLA